MKTKTKTYKQYPKLTHNGYSKMVVFWQTSSCITEVSKRTKTPVALVKRYAHVLRHNGVKLKYMPKAPGFIPNWNKLQVLAVRHAPSKN